MVCLYGDANATTRWCIVVVLCESNHWWSRRRWLPGVAAIITRCRRRRPLALSVSCQRTISTSSSHLLLHRCARQVRWAEVAGTVWAHAGTARYDITFVPTAAIVTADSPQPLHGAVGVIARTYGSHLARLDTRRQQWRKPRQLTPSRTAGHVLAAAAERNVRHDCNGLQFACDLHVNFCRLKMLVGRSTELHRLKDADCGTVAERLWSWIRSTRTLHSPILLSCSQYVNLMNPLMNR